MSGLAAAGPIWFDVTRLVTRIGRSALTGIDRVELAYLKALIHCDAQFLCRTTRGTLLLGKSGGSELLALAEGRKSLGSADVLSVLTGRGHKPRHKVEAALRPHALAKARRGGLRLLVKNNAKTDITYLNVGHSNLSIDTLATLAGLPNVRLAVMVHDIIPILHPEHSSAGMPQRFAGRVERVREFADLVICNSDATRRDLEHLWAKHDTRPETTVAHLGVAPLKPSSLPRDPRRFLMLGTVESRKNHGLILDVWDLLARDMPKAQLPHLHIVGAEGWRVEEVMQRLRSHPLLGRAVFWHGPASDREVADHLAQAQALLFPSIAEGFGYPPLEAAMAGALPICSDLAVFRETLGNAAVYVKGMDAYSWLETIKKEIQGKESVRDLTQLRVPSWDDHFEKVGQALAHLRAEGP